MSVQAVSFDLWDTVFIDDSDEPKRKQRGLDPKPIARRKLLSQALGGSDRISSSLVNCAYDTTDAAFRHVWHEQHVTWSVAQRLRIVLAGLGQDLAEDAFNQLVAQHEHMELEVSPDLVPGVTQAIQQLAKRYRLVVISDAIFSPGWALRRLLERFGLAQYFCDFVFSDEVGHSKPDPTLFQLAAQYAGCALEQLVHIGDRESNDIIGPQALGAKAILLTCVIDRGSQHTQAQTVCNDYKTLPDLISRL